MYKKYLLYLIVLSSALRIITASLIELGNDEVYYYTYALHLQSNYFDHPPGVALMIRLFTFNLALEKEVFIRMGSIVFAGIGTVISFNICKLIQNERAGWYAAILYNTSIYSSIIAGLFILPDSPQIVFWLASLYIMMLIARKSSAQSNISAFLWIVFGIANGLCIMCKVHGIFLWGGFGLYALLCDKKLFFHKGFYIAILITTFIISPIILWNFQNHFVTWNYHSNRVQGTHLDKDSFVQAFFGQLFYNNPINVILIIISIISLIKANFFKQSPNKLFLFCGIPMIVVVTFMSLFNTVLPHWSGPGFLSLSFLAAVSLEQKTALKNISFLPTVLKFSSALVLFLFISGTLLINLYPGTFGSRNKDNYGETDFSLDMYGWKKFETVFSKWCKQEENLHLLSPHIKIVCNKWFPASHLEYYVARPMHSYVIGEGNQSDLHHFIWLNNYRPSLKPGENALCIIPSNYSCNPVSCYTKAFNKITLLNTFTQYRYNKVCRYFKVYMLESFNEQH